MTNIVNIDKLWQFVETGSFILVGTALFQKKIGFNKIASIAFAALAFLAGKGVYFITTMACRALISHPNSYVVVGLGLAAALPAGAFAGYQLFSRDTNYRNCLDVTAITTVAAIVLREAVMYGFNKALKN